MQPMDRQRDAGDENGPRMALQETMFSLNLIFWESDGCVALLEYSKRPDSTIFY